MNFPDLFTQTAIVFGVSLIVNRSNLLDFVRGYKAKVKDYFTTMSGSQFEGPINKQWLTHKFLIKLINCWICTSFWSGVGLSLFHIGCFQNPIIGGLYSVGAVGFYQFYLDMTRK